MRVIVTGMSHVARSVCLCVCLSVCQGRSAEVPSEVEVPEGPGASREGGAPSWSRDYVHFWSSIGSYILLAVHIMALKLISAAEDHITLPLHSCRH